jgi:hypothetical protein
MKEPSGRAGKNLLSQVTGVPGDGRSPVQVVSPALRKFREGRNVRIADKPAKTDVMRSDSGQNLTNRTSQSSPDDTLILCGYEGRRVRIPKFNEP